MIRQLLSRIVHGAPSEEARLLAEANAFPRYTPHRFRYRDLTLQVTDMLSVAWQVQEFFVEERLKFTATGPRPVIIDCGSNVGISVLYQRRMHPDAQITCFEPDPAVFACLQENLRANGVNGVDCRREAVWVHNDGVTFSSEGADGGSISGTGVKVPSVRLRQILEQHAHIDLLKVDIEGAETEVLLDCAEALERVRFLYVEFHSYAGAPQRLHELLTLLARHGFRYYILRIGVHHTHPFAGLEPAVMDMQLDIHAIRG